MSKYVYVTRIFHSNRPEAMDNWLNKQHPVFVSICGLGLNKLVVTVQRLASQVERDTAG